MRPLHRAPPSIFLRPFAVVLSTFVLAGLLAGRAAADEKSAETKVQVPALEKPAPENVEDLRAIQQQVKEVLKKVVPATVGIRADGASGSGVIIDKEGRVLTAGHVSGAADRTVTIILPDGKEVKGKTLGANLGIDSGLIKITDKGDYPFVEMGKSSELKKGQWCIATGHPGGFRPGRTPVVRLGRILDARPSAVRTDCALVGGDSGGPLFDMQGRVIGIHSRIGGQITANLHVPVDTYRDTWDRLVKAEVWANVPYLGIEGDPDGKDARITKIIKGAAAEKAGLQVDDVITSFDGKKIERYDDLPRQIMRKKIGDKVAVEVLRGDKTVKLEVVLGKRPD